jgi:hypothetical protein
MRQFARAFPVVLIAVCLATAQSSIVSLTEALQKYLGTPDDDTRKTGFAVSFVDLTDDGNKEANRLSVIKWVVWYGGMYDADLGPTRYVFPCCLKDSRGAASY